MSGGFFLGQSQRKKKLDSFRASDSSLDAGHHRDLPPTIGTAVLSQLHQEATIDDVSWLTEKEKMAVPRRPVRQPPTPAMLPRLGTPRLGTEGRWEPSLLRPNQDLDSRLFSRAHSGCFGWLSILVVAIFRPVGWIIRFTSSPAAKPSLFFPVALVAVCCPLPLSRARNSWPWHFPLGMEQRRAG